jgi:hypothetical protein
LLANSSSKNVHSVDSSSNFVSFSTPRPSERGVQQANVKAVGLRRIDAGSSTQGRGTKSLAKLEQNYLNQRVCQHTTRNGDVI